MQAVDADAISYAMQEGGQSRRYSYSSGASGATASGNTYSSGASGATTKAPTAAPTAAPTPKPTVAGAAAKKITQTVKIAGTVATYVGALKALFEMSYAVEIGIASSTGGAAHAYKTGCSCSSTATAARRADINVALEATVTADIADAAKAKATTMTTASLTASMTAVKASGGATYAAVTVPEVKTIQAPVMTTVVSGVERSATFGVLALVAGVVAMRQ